MTVPRSMKFFLVFALVILTCSAAVHGANLYPACNGDELRGFAGANAASTVYELRRKSRNLTLTCLAYELTSLKGGAGDRDTDPCRVEHQTEYLHRLVIRATWKDRTTRRPVVRDFDVKDHAAGSLSNVAIRLPEEAVFSLVFMNLATNMRCSLQIRAIMDYTQSAAETHNDQLPVVISLVPRTVYVRSTSTTKFILRYPSGTDLRKVEEDTVTLVNLDEECADDFLSKRYLRLPSVPMNLDAFTDTSTLIVQEYFFDVPGSYRLCHRAKGDTTSSELAVVRVFDGNPSYYEIVQGQDAEGRVFVGTDAVIKFYGYDLDTRPGGDRAKFARDDDECSTATPAGGVPEATDLGPSDDYGAGTTYTLWRWNLKEGGAFKVCYKRHSGHWTEVPSISDVGTDHPPRDSSGSRPSETPIPHPRDPVTKEECPMAPVNTRQNPWISYKSLKLTLNESKVSDDFLKHLSRLFCIPRAALTVTHMTHNEEDRQVMYISIICEDIDEGRSCSTLERQNYITFLGSENSTILSDVGIASVEGSKYMFAYGDDSVIVKTYGNHLLTISIICGTVLLVAAMAVYGVVKYRENRQYFVHFGIDDEDVGDMYATNDALHTGGGGGGGRYPVKDSVIEVEE